MRQPLHVALWAAAVVACASCQSASQQGAVPEELRGLYANVSRLAGTDAIRADIAEHHMRVGVFNSPLARLPSDDRQRTARDIARAAYLGYRSRASLRVVDVAFVIAARRLFVLPYEDGRDSFRFQAAEIIPPPPTLSEGWVRTGQPERDLYFVAVGDVPGDVMHALVTHFTDRFGIPITVLPAVAPDRATYNPERFQLIADELIAAVRVRYASLVKNPRTRIIAITPYDMYMRVMETRWRFAYSLRGSENRTAVVSYARLDPAELASGPADNPLLGRLRKMVAKNVGILYFDLPLSRDPRSVLYENILGAEELDLMSEHFLPQ